MASFNNSPEQLQQLIDALKGVMGNSRYERASVSKDAGAEDALKQYETILREETTLRGKFNKTFESGLRGAIKTLAGLPQTLNQVYDQLEAGMRTNNDAINKIQKMTIDSVKANKLNSKQIEKLAEETGSMANAVSQQTKSFKTNSALEAALKQKERSLDEKRLQLMASHHDKTKQEAIAVGETKRKLNEELQSIGKNLTSVNDELKVVKDDIKYVTKDLADGVTELRKSFDSVSKSEMFKALDEIDQAHIEDMIRNPTQQISASVVSAMESFEEMSETVQHTLKTLVTQSVNHIRNSMNDMSSKLQRAGAMAVVSGKGILDSYRAQLSANLLESTPVAIAGYGMDAGEQAEIIKSYARELASISGTNNMSKAYNESVSLSDLHDTAKLYGLTGKAAQELALQSVRTVNQMGAGTKDQTTATTKVLMEQISSSAAYLQMGKDALAQDIAEGVASGSYDSELTRLRLQGKTGADLSKHMIHNITALKANTAQLGFSNTYAQQLLQNSINAKFGGLSDVIKRKVGAGVGGQIIPSMLGGNVTKEQMEAFKIAQEGGGFSALKTPEQREAFLQLSKSFATSYANAYENRGSSTQAQAEFNKMAAQIDILRNMGVDIASPEMMAAALRADFQGQSTEAQTVRDKAGNIISSPVLNMDKQAVAAAGSIESFNNTMGVFEQEFLELAEWASGISKNPFGNFAGAAIGGLGSMLGSAIGTSLAMGGLGAASGGVIGAGLIAAAPIVGALLAAAVATATAMALADAVNDAWFQHEKRQVMAKDIETVNAAMAAGRFNRRKEREAAGGMLEISDLKAQAYEDITGEKLTYEDDFDSVNFILNGEKLDEAQIKAIEDAVYARQIAATGHKDLLTNASPSVRRDIINAQNTAYRDKKVQENTKNPPKPAETYTGSIIDSAKSLLGSSISIPQKINNNDVLVRANQGDDSYVIMKDRSVYKNGVRLNDADAAKILQRMDKTRNDVKAQMSDAQTTITPQTSAVANSIPSVVSPTLSQPAISGMSVDNLSPLDMTPSTITPQTSVMVPTNGQVPAGFKQGFDWNNFKDNSIGLRESGGRYDIIGGSSDLYSGKYQMGAAALIDAGLMTEGNRDVNDPANWTIPGGREAFLNSPEIQENAYKTYIEKMRGYVSNSLSDNYNIDFDSLPVEDQAGIVAAAHLTGQGAAARLYATGEFSSDAFNTSNKEYYDRARIAQLQSNSKNVSINPTPIVSGIQSNVTGSINNSLSNPNSNPNTMWNVIANIMSNGNNALLGGVQKLSDIMQLNTKLTGQTATNTDPQINRKSEPESEKRPDFTSRNRPQNGLFGSVW